jgi:ribosome maturation factor RimP
MRCFGLITSAVRKSMSDKTTDRLIEIIAPMIAPLGYDVVHVEVQMLRHKTLRLFIDFLNSNGEKAVGIEDCVKVTKALDEPLDQHAEIDAMFKGSYELEVSSPGVDRPLRTERDYERFSGKEVKINVYRPLTPEEIENEKYQTKNPKQKNFQGKLLGFKDGKVRLKLVVEAPKLKKQAEVERGEEITIPLPLISKANIEPKFDLE